MFRFIFGLIVGSFLNVLSMRYKEDKFLFSSQILGGRSHCPHCGKTLSALELMPVLSFIFQKGKCKTCKAKIGWEYPVVELFSAFIFFFTPFIARTIPLSILWVSIFEILLLASLIDKRLRIIPDELSALLGIAGILSVFYEINLVGPYFLLFGSVPSPWLNHLLGLAVAAGFLGLVFLITQGRGMGFGDVKLGAVLGLILGWPGSLVFLVLSFLLGGLVGILLILFRQKEMRSSVPFGPFLSLGFLMLFFFGQNILTFYFETLTGWGLKFFGV